MKSVSKILLFLFLVSLTSGCLDVEMKLKLKPDGSGTIEETVLMSDNIVAMFSSFTEMGDSTEESSFDLFDEEELKTEAAQMGEGVKYVSGEKITFDGKQGYKALYTFEDINKIKMDRDPSSKVPGDEMGMVSEEEESGEYFTFEFTKGDPSTLIINLPKEEKTEVDVEEEEYEEETDSLDTGGLGDEMLEMFKDFRIGISLEVDGEIIESNATFQEDNNITLLEMNFGELFETPEKLNEFKKSNPDTFEETAELLKEIPGFKFELKEKVKVKFK